MSDPLIFQHFLTKEKFNPFGLGAFKATLTSSTVKGASKIEADSGEIFLKKLKRKIILFV